MISQFEKGLVLRLGRYRATVGPGLTFLMPVIEDILKVDMRERVINVEPQKVITKDNVSVTVDAVIYYRIIDPVKATFEVQNFGYAATTLAQTNLRNLIGDKSLDETLTARDTINANLRNVLDEATNTWGVKVTRVEVQKIDPPADITEAMSRQMKAERDKRANILEAEGVKLAFVHGDDASLLESLEYSGHFDYVFYGHTHVAREHRRGTTRVINPGALYRVRTRTFAILDAETGQIEAVVVT